MVGGSTLSQAGSKFKGTCQSQPNIKVSNKANKCTNNSNRISLSPYDRPGVPTGASPKVSKGLSHWNSVPVSLAPYKGGCCSCFRVWRINFLYISIRYAKNWPIEKGRGTIARLFTVLLYYFRLKISICIFRFYEISNIHRAYMSYVNF